MRATQIVALHDLRALPQVALPTPHFLVLLALAPPGVPDDHIERVAAGLMTQGAVGFVCVGPDADRVERLIDDVAMAHDDGRADRDASTVIWTTSHAQGGLSDALAFLRIAAPAPAYAETCGATLAIVVGDDLWAAQVARARGVSSSR